MRTPFDPVRREFDRILAETQGGAAFCAIRDGVEIVNLHGGSATCGQQRPWTVETTTTVFSGSKGLVTMCLAVLVERGELDLDAPVARYWPEFAQCGKGELTVRDVATHRAGLAAMPARITLAELADVEHMTQWLCSAAPDPRFAGRFTYHAFTFGWLCAELVHRASGSSFRDFFQEHVAVPANADIQFGIDPSQCGRVADLFTGPDRGVPESAPDLDYALQVIGPLELWRGNELAWNLPLIREAEIPGAGAIGNARSMARCYAAFAGGAEPLVSGDTLAAFTQEAVVAGDAVWGGATERFGVGFQLQSRVNYFGPPVDAFGHTGAGGSTHGWWPGHRVAFSFVMNEMRDESADRRAGELLDALHDCLDDRLVVP